MNVAVLLDVLNNLETEDFEGYEFNTSTATLRTLTSKNTTL